jgi:hypothetical protein
MPLMGHAEKHGPFSLPYGKKQQISLFKCDPHHIFLRF